jgi:hypothetical protein
MGSFGHAFHNEIPIPLNNVTQEVRNPIVLLHETSYSTSKASHRLRVLDPSEFITKHATRHVRKLAGTMSWHLGFFLMLFPFSEGRNCL